MIEMGGTGRLEWGACTAAGNCCRSAIWGDRLRLYLRGAKLFAFECV